MVAAISLATNLRTCNSKMAIRFIWNMFFARWRCGNSLDSLSVGIGFDSRSVHPDSDFSMVFRNHSRRMLGWVPNKGHGRFLPNPSPIPLPCANCTVSNDLAIDRRTGFNPRPGHRIFAYGNRARRYRWSAGFLGDLPCPTPFNSGVAPYSPPSPSSALKTSLIRAAQISSLTLSDKGDDNTRGQRPVAPTCKALNPRAVLPLLRSAVQLMSVTVLVCLNVCLWEREIPEKTHRPAASSCTILPFENLGATRRESNPVLLGVNVCVTAAPTKISSRDYQQFDTKLRPQHTSEPTIAKCGDRDVLTGFRASERVKRFGRLLTVMSWHPMKVIEVSMEQRWNEWAGGTGISHAKVRPWIVIGEEGGGAVGTRAPRGGNQATVVTNPLMAGVLVTVYCSPSAPLTALNCVTGRTLMRLCAPATPPAEKGKGGGGYASASWKLNLTKPGELHHCLKAVHDKVSTIEINLRKKKSLLLPADILTSALSDMRPTFACREQSKGTCRATKLFVASDAIRDPAEGVGQISRSWQPLNTPWLLLRGDQCPKKLGLGAVIWPSRSPDLTPLYYFLWDVVKGVEYEAPMPSEEDLTARIHAATQLLSTQPRVSTICRRCNRVQGSTIRTPFVICNILFGSVFGAPDNTVQYRVISISLSDAAYLQFQQELLPECLEDVSLEVSENTLRDHCQIGFVLADSEPVTNAVQFRRRGPMRQWREITETNRTVLRAPSHTVAFTRRVSRPLVHSHHKHLVRRRLVVSSSSPMSLAALDFTRLPHSARDVRPRGRWDIYRVVGQRPEMQPCAESPSSQYIPAHPPKSLASPAGEGE
ncbi:hypothetical protein PR048_028048 [Dryococelus australis]|uniref:Uncharacterized protein n=1 Tax=Dryococelus australis TaxID=614101 RepID=A0ABQ9GI47_9NEOP|nr:hypothetical protein PR048_028048 [Dryococelus australis]